MDGWVAAEKLGLPTSPPYLSLVSNVHNNSNNVSFLRGVNFASGGAGIFNVSDNGFVSTVLIFSFLLPVFVFIYHVLCSNCCNLELHMMVICIFNIRLWLQFQ